MCVQLEALLNEKYIYLLKGSPLTNIVLGHNNTSREKKLIKNKKICNSSLCFFFALFLDRTKQISPRITFMTFYKLFCLHDIPVSFILN